MKKLTWKDCENDGLKYSESFARGYHYTISLSGSHEWGNACYHVRVETHGKIYDIMKDKETLFFDDRESAENAAWEHSQGKREAVVYDSSFIDSNEEGLVWQSAEENGFNYKAAFVDGKHYTVSLDGTHAYGNAGYHVQVKMDGRLSDIRSNPGQLHFASLKDAEKAAYDHSQGNRKADLMAVPANKLEAKRCHVAGAVLSHCLMIDKAKLARDHYESDYMSLYNKIATALVDTQFAIDQALAADLEMNLQNIERPTRTYDMIGDDLHKIAEFAIDFAKTSYDDSSLKERAALMALIEAAHGFIRDWESTINQSIRHGWLTRQVYKMGYYGMMD